MCPSNFVKNIKMKEDFFNRIENRFEGYWIERKDTEKGVREVLVSISITHLAIVITLNRKVIFKEELNGGWHWIENFLCFIDGMKFSVENATEDSMTLMEHTPGEVGNLVQRFFLKRGEIPLSILN